MYDFDYARPSSIAEAAALLAQDPDARALAGGMTLIPTLKQRLAAPSRLVDLSAIDGLGDIAFDGSVLTICAMARHADVAASPGVRERLPALARLAAGIGDPHVRNRGTLGGSVANADPAADYPAAVLGLDATVVTDRRSIAADAFFTGLFETALEPGELIVALRFPSPDLAAYAKFANPASGYATVGVFIARHNGSVRVAVTGAGPCVFRVPAMEAALGRSFTPQALDGVIVQAEGLNEDPHAGADYRASLIGVMARRALAACRST